MTKATTPVLLRKNKDPLNCEPYHPVSLLFSDYEIYKVIVVWGHIRVTHIGTRCTEVVGKWGTIINNSGQA